MGVWESLEWDPELQGHIRSEWLNFTCLRGLARAGFGGSDRESWRIPAGPSIVSDLWPSPLRYLAFLTSSVKELKMFAA